MANVAKWRKFANTLRLSIAMQSQNAGVEGNYLETSGTALFAYAVLKGVRLGYLPKRMAAWFHNTLLFLPDLLRYFGILFIFQNF